MPLNCSCCNTVLVEGQNVGWNQRMWGGRIRMITEPNCDTDNTRPVCEQCYKLAEKYEMKHGYGIIPLEAVRKVTIEREKLEKEKIKKHELIVAERDTLQKEIQQLENELKLQHEFANYYQQECFIINEKNKLLEQEIKLEAESKNQTEKKYEGDDVMINEKLIVKENFSADIPRPNWVVRKIKEDDEEDINIFIDINSSIVIYNQDDVVSDFFDEKQMENMTIYGVWDNNLQKVVELSNAAKSYAEKLKIKMLQISSVIPDDESEVILCETYVNGALYRVRGEILNSHHDYDEYESLIYVDHFNGQKCKDYIKNNPDLLEKIFQVGKCSIFTEKSNMICEFKTDLINVKLVLPKTKTSLETAKETIQQQQNKIVQLEDENKKIKDELASLSKQLASSSSCR
jgi:hypothetical protein